MESFSRTFMIFCFVIAGFLFSTGWQKLDKTFLTSFFRSNVQAGVDRNSVAESKASNNMKLIVDLSDRRVYVYRENKILKSYPVAVGQKSWKTPTGNFRIMNKYRNPTWIQPITREVIKTGPNNPLGDRWIGFWSDGTNQIGFHGTNKEQLVGQAVSHGCLRMLNRDIRSLYAEVSQGTPVIVRN